MAIKDIVGYIAATMVLLTFITKEMRVLRLLAILSNIAFITYGALVWLPPVFCLHCVLLPVNVLRLREIILAEGPPAPVGRLRTAIHQPLSK